MSEETGGRSRRLTWGILSSTLARLTAVLAPLVTVPVALGALGVDGYGAWAAALSLTSFVAFADLGLGAGLMTALPKATAAGDMERARRLVTAAYTTLAAVSTICVLAILVLIDVVSWASMVGGGRANAEVQVGLIVVTTLVGYSTNIVVGLISRVQQAAQFVARSYIWQTAGALLGIVAVLWASSLGAGGAMYVAVATFTPIAVAALNAVVFFSRDGRTLSPSPRHFAWPETREMLAIGGRFLLISLLMSATLGTDVWIVATSSGLADAADYAIPARIFAVIGTLVAAIATPLWPIGAQALAAGDTAWVRRVVRRLTIITVVLVGAMSTVAVVAGPRAFAWWLGDTISVNTTLLIGLAAWNVAQAVVAPIFMVQNASRVLGPQTIAYAVLLLVIPLKWAVVNESSYVWLPLVSVCAYCAIVWPAAFIGYRRSLALQQKPRSDVRE